MKKMKRISSTILLLSAVVIASTPALASPSVAYYQFPSNWKSGVVVSPQFPITNSANVVTIYGWQDTGSTQYPASVQYNLYQYNFWGDKIIGSTRINGNYPRYDNTWYKHTYTGVTPGDFKYYLLMTPNQTAVATSGGGNAYDGY